MVRERQRAGKQPVRTKFEILKSSENKMELCISTYFVLMQQLLFVPRPELQWHHKQVANAKARNKRERTKMTYAEILAFIEAHRAVFSLYNKCSGTY